MSIVVMGPGSRRHSLINGSITHRQISSRALRYRKNYYQNASWFSFKKMSERRCSTELF